jgi:hypothetical protein
MATAKHTDETLYGWVFGAVIVTAAIVFLIAGVIASNTRNNPHLDCTVGSVPVIVDIDKQGDYDLPEQVNANDCTLGLE